MKIGVNSLQDFMSFLIRRRWWVLVPFIALSCIVAIITKSLPRVYVSQSLVIANPRDVPENFVMDLSANSAEQRLKSIQQIVMSRSNIDGILKNHPGDFPELARLNADEAIERFRKQIDITFNIERDSRTGANTVLSFLISYQHKNPVIAQKIAQELTDLFVKQEGNTRATHVEGTTTFLKAELEKKEALLKVSDDTVKTLKGAHLYELPERLEGNQRDLERLSSDKGRTIEAISRIANAKLSTQQLMTQVPEFLPTPPPAPVQPKEKNAALEVYLKAKDEFERQSLLRREGHPDFDQAKRIMERAKERVPADVLEEYLNPPPPPAKVEAEKKRNPAYIQLEFDLRNLELEHEILVKQRKAIEESISRIAGRVDRTPQVELLLADAERENEDLRRQRDTLSQDLTKAELAQNLETSAHGGNFQVVDNANLPLEADKPNKGVILLIGCLASLALSIGFAFVVDLARQRVWTQSEIESFWGVPVMVDIPAIVSDSDQIVLRKKRMAFAVSLLACFAVYSVFLYGLYLKQNFILRQLDPVLQKLVYRQ